MLLVWPDLGGGAWLLYLSGVAVDKWNRVMHRCVESQVIQPFCTAEQA